MRACCTCQHVKRAEIDRRLAAGEPVTRVAGDYQINPSSLHRHRQNCLKLGSANAIKKEAARGSAALALLPSRETLGGSYWQLRERIDQIAAQAEQQGSLSIALSGLNALRHTLDSLARLVGSDPIAATSPAPDALDLAQLTEALVAAFDNEPDIKARIAAALLRVDARRSAAANAAAPATAAPPSAIPTETTAPSPAVTASCPATATASCPADTAPTAAAVSDLTSPIASHGVASSPATTSHAVGPLARNAPVMPPPGAAVSSAALDVAGHQMHDAAANVAPDDPPVGAASTKPTAPAAQEVSSQPQEGSHA
jgi:hypothetical protein